MFPHLTTLEWDGDVDGAVLEVGGGHLHVEGPSVDVEEDVLGALALGHGLGDLAHRHLGLILLEVEHVALAHSAEVQLHVECVSVSRCKRRRTVLAKLFFYNHKEIVEDCQNVNIQAVKGSLKSKAAFQHIKKPS